MPFAPAALSVFLAGSVATGLPDEKMAEDLPPPTAESASPSTKPMTEKRSSIAGDVAGCCPVCELANDTGPMGGPLTRLGFQATRHLEVGLRSGFLHGLDKETAYGSSAMSGVPILASVRWFVLDHQH